MLLELGANANAQAGRWYKTPLFFAAHHGNEGLVRALLDKGANPTGRCVVDSSISTQNKTALHVVTGTRRDYYDSSELHDAVLSALLEKVDDPNNLNLKDSYENTALHFAANRNKGVNTVRMLLANGADPNAQNRWGKTALHHADPDVASVLTAHKSIDPNIQDTDENTPLHLAVEKGFSGKTRVSILVGLKNIDIDVENGKGDTPLMIAEKKIEEICASGGHAEQQKDYETLRDLLIEHGAAVND